MEGSALHRRFCWRLICLWRIRPPTTSFRGMPKGRRSWCGSRRSLLGISSQHSSSTATSLALYASSILMYVWVWIILHSIIISIWLHGDILPSVIVLTTWTYIKDLPSMKQTVGSMTKIYIWSIFNLKRILFMRFLSQINGKYNWISDHFKYLFLALRELNPKLNLPNNIFG